MIRYLSTYIAYVLLCAIRQPLAVTKSSLLEVQVPFTSSEGETWLGLLDTLFLTSYALGSFASGWLGDRFSSKILLLSSMTISALLCGLIAIGVGSLPFFTILFSLAGLSQSAGWPACLFLLGARPSGLALGIWTSHGSVGGILGKVLGAVFLAEWNWQVVFLGLGLLCLVGSAIVALLLYYLPPSTTEVSVNIGSTAVSFWEVAFHTPDLLTFSACFFFVKLTVYSFLGWLPVYLTTLGYSPLYAGLIATTYDVGSIIGGVGAGYWLDRNGKPASLCLSTLVLAAGLLVLYVFYGSVNLTLQIILLFLVGLSLNVSYILISGKISADIGDRRPATKATVSGIINGCGGLGAALQGVGIGILGQNLEWNYILTILIGCTVTAASLLIPITRRERSSENT